MTIKLFRSHDILKVSNHLQAGGIALHVWRGKCHHATPICFMAGELWGHLMDLDMERLMATARRLGVQNIHVSKKGKRDQHIDLCKGPLHRAIREGEWYNIEDNR